MNKALRSYSLRINYLSIRERLTQIESKLAEVKAGRAVEYIVPLEELQVGVTVYICTAVYRVGFIYPQICTASA